MSKPWKQILFAKQVQRVIDDTNSDVELKRVLGPIHLTLMGIGAMIGTGIFVLTGTAAAGTVDRPGAGPAIVISFLLTGVACGLAALCYAEFAAMVPVSGSAYTYAYASFGELFAWIIGWDLLVEYAVGNVGVAIGWSEYLASLLHSFGIHIPPWLAIDPMSIHSILQSPESYTPQRVEYAQQAFETAPHFIFPIYFNLPAFLIVAAVTVLLVIGIRESARANSVMVVLKLLLISLFIYIGCGYVNFENHWQNFAPNGLNGIITGSALIFFAYVGFDAISTTAEECRRPQRDIPIAMLVSLLVCSILYVAVAAVLTGMVSLEALNNAEPVAAAMQAVGETSVARLISAGAIISMLNVLLVLQFGQSRILFAMSRDGLLPRVFSRINRRFQTPIWATVLTGIVVAIPAASIDITVAAELCNIGTFFAFGMVAAGILYLRYKQPETSRPFRVPFAAVVCPACILMCLVLSFGLPLTTWIRFVVWMAVGLAVYFLTVFPRKLRTLEFQNTI